MDATQLISDSISESEEEELEKGNNDRGDPQGKLCILKNEHIPEKEFPLFLGDNILGRDPKTCTLSLLAPSVSKQHATISLCAYRRKGCDSEVEALLWDLGSMNGTRKGCFKLTPNVRYALSEGDCLVVADIPCKYMKWTSVTPNLHLKARLSDTLRENGSNLATSKTKNTAVSTKSTDSLADSEVTRGTPARMSCLSFEQTPTQPQGTLVPESGSESDEERSNIGDKRCKTIVSDSDSYKSSPTCSTFMSPANKVVPESEDESPITPSSSYKNRTHKVVSFHSEESDIDINRRELKKIVALEVVDDSEEEAGNEKAGSALKNMCDKNGQPVQVKEKCNLTPLETDALPQFNMDSDTDLEEEEEKLTPPALVTSNKVQDPAPFHIDSDTDVDDSDLEKCLDQSNTPKHSLCPIPDFEPKGISVDSDTDVEDGDLLSAATSNQTVSQTANRTEFVASTNPNDFHLDSDTDVDEDKTDFKGTEIVGTHQLEITPVESTSAAQQDIHLDSDTDDEEIIRNPPMEATKNKFEQILNSDTNVEENSPQVESASSRPTAAEGQVDTDEDAGVNESIVSPIAEENPAVTVDSDTDVEDKDAEIQETGNNQGMQVSSQENSYTHLQLPEGNMEEIETQAFLSPSHRSAPGRSITFSSSLDEDDDAQSFAFHNRGQGSLHKDTNTSSVLESPVNEQEVSFTSEGNLQLELSDSSVLQCQAQALATESTQAFVNDGVNLEETQPYIDAISNDEKELPVDIALQATQAYIADSNSDEEEETDEDQPTEMVMSDLVTSSAVPETKYESEKIEEQEKATRLAEVLSLAETQPMYMDEESDSEESGPVFRKRKPRQIQEEETQTLTNSEVTLAETQPVTMTEETGSDEDFPVCKKKKAKQIQEETQPLSNSEQKIAETQPMEISEISGSNQESAEEPTQVIESLMDEQNDKVGDSIEIISKSIAKNFDSKDNSQPHLVLGPTGAQTQPIVLSETDQNGGNNLLPSERNTETKQPQEKDISLQTLVVSEVVTSDEEDSIVVRKKRKVQKLEDTQQSLINSESQDTQDTKSTLSKESERPAKGEANGMNVRRRQGVVEFGKDEEVSSDSPKRQTKGKKKATQGYRGSRGKSKVEQEDEDEKEEAQLGNEEQRNEDETADQHEKQKEHGVKRVETQVEERKTKLNKAQLQLQEKEQIGKEKQEKKNEEDQAPSRGRRTARRTTAPNSPITADDIPAMRTRSRSNSSNSVGSERSLSSISSQTSKGGRGRGRAARRTEVQAEKTPSRGSNRRRTLAAELSIQTTEVPAPSPRPTSRSNTNNSDNSLSSVSSVSSQGRGRGGRQRGRGRRTEAEPECASVQSDQVTAQKAPQRGRKSTRICANDEEHRTKQSVSTGEQGGAKEESSECTPHHEEDQTNQEKASSSTEIRRGRTRQRENNDTNKSDTKYHEAKEEEEEKDVSSTAKRKAGANTTRPKKSSKGNGFEDITEIEKSVSKHRPSIVQRKKSEEQGDSGASSNNSMVQEETPSCSVSRKRPSADPHSSPLSKTPRSARASPNTVGRSRAATQAYKVLFTGVMDEAGEKVLPRLGGSIAKDVADMNCLVTDKVRRTVKFLCAVAKGVPIVTTQWLEKSGKAQTFLSPSDYIVKDREQEQKFNFNLQDSLRVANSQPLLQGYEIHVTKSVKPEPLQMKDIISCSGAVFLPRMPSSKKPQMLVISCEEDLSLCAPALSSAIPVVSAEFILTGILQQKLDFETHKLSVPVAATPTAGGRGRGRKKT